MNEELQKALAEIITGALQTVEQTKAFVLAEMPDVVQQLLMWKMAESLVYCALGAFQIAVIFFYWRFVYKRRAQIAIERNGEAYCVPGVIGTFVFGLTGSFLVNLTWLQIWLAPKVYLIEYAASLVK